MSIRKPRLELTWVGKEDRPKLKPRVLIEDPDLSYHVSKRQFDGDIFDNRLIFGDNLLALKAIEQEFTGKVNCVYIDPPFNTGEMFENYDDGLEHSIWLGQMRQRFTMLHRLLAQTGSLFVHLNDDELDYCKVTLDEIFGRKNFVNRFTVDARSPSAFSTVNPGIFKAAEYVLWYAKDKESFQSKELRIPRTPDYAYRFWIESRDLACSTWKLEPLGPIFEQRGPRRATTPAGRLKEFDQFIIKNARNVCRTASISESGAGEAVLALRDESLRHPGTVVKLERPGPLDDIFAIDGEQLIFYDKQVEKIDGKLTATKLLTNIWDDIAWEGIAGEGGVTFRKGKKPEKLIRRILSITTKPGDLVLDSFAGSGTTGAVAHKMGRRWIMVELGPHAHTHIIPRMRKVVDGTDRSGISTAVEWKGGGGFRYFRLAPTLLINDDWGQKVINPDYNAEMLSEAVCKLQGFTFAPSTVNFWQHGHSSERDFIYVTTQHLTGDQISQISSLVGHENTLLICCSSFRMPSNGCANLTVKKIPKSVLDKAEWNRDDYSLKIDVLPEAEKPMANMGLKLEEE